PMASRPRKSKGRRGTARTDFAQPKRFNALEIAKAGRKVYERHRIDFERHHQGQYVLIDIRIEKVYIADSPEAAYRQVAPEHRKGSSTSRARATKSSWGWSCFESFGRSSSYQSLTAWYF